jgi:hypothetical protein
LLLLLFVVLSQLVYLLLLLPLPMGLPLLASCLLPHHFLSVRLLLLLLLLALQPLLL